MYRLVMVLFIFSSHLVHGVSAQKLASLISHLPEKDSVTLYQGQSDNEDVLVVCHGFGSNFKKGSMVAKNISEHVVSFNFPDSDWFGKNMDPSESVSGTFEELKPLFELLHLLVIEGGIEEVDLYGFSAGGGAVINILATLNTNRFQNELELIGILEKDKVRLLEVLQNNIVLLDSPLKSIEEVEAYRGESELFSTIKERYQENKMSPIESLFYLKGLRLNIALYFQDPDDVISNRDDDIFINRIQSINQGRTEVCFGFLGSHSSNHKALFREYKALKKKLVK